VPNFTAGVTGGGASCAGCSWIAGIAALHFEQNLSLTPKVEPHSEQYMGNLPFGLKHLTIIIRQNCLILIYDIIFKKQIKFISIR
jgi:hypothetical protein